MTLAAGVACFSFSTAKSQHFSHFHTFYGRMGADIGFLKAICDFRQQFLGKALSVSVSGRQKANIELIWARRGCLGEICLQKNHGRQTHFIRKPFA